MNINKDLSGIFYFLIQRLDSIGYYRFSIHAMCAMLCIVPSLIYLNIPIEKYRMGSLISC